MIPEDNGTNTTQQIYQLATQPIFATDHNVEPENVSWEVSDGSLDHLATPVEDNTGQEESPVHPDNEDVEKSRDIASESNDPLSEDEEEKTKKKNRISERKRIAQLTRQLKQAQSVTHDVLARNQYLETKLTEKQKEAFASEENFLSSQKERVKKILTDAIEEGDAPKIAEAQDLLSQYNAQIQLKKTQATTFQNTPQNTYTPPSQDVGEHDDDINEEGRTWLETNSWADPKADDFDEDLYNVADQYSIKLAKKYTLQGKKSDIGSPKFWNEITNYMNESYDISDESSSEDSYTPPPKTQPKGRTPMKNTSSNTVAPVSRQSVPGESPRKQNDIVLTPEQRDAAYAMRGYVRDPKTGQPINDRKVLEEVYKRNMR